MYNIRAMDDVTVVATGNLVTKFFLIYDFEIVQANF